MDEMIGELLDALEETGQLDDTLVVYASDHGDHVGERGLWWKHTFFEESVRVPLVMRLPGTVASGTVVTDNVSLLIDLSQTMLDVLGAEPDPGRRRAAASGHCSAETVRAATATATATATVTGRTARTSSAHRARTSCSASTAPTRHRPGPRGARCSSGMVREGRLEARDLRQRPARSCSTSATTRTSCATAPPTPRARDVYERLFARASEGWSAEGSARDHGGARARQKAAIADWVRVTDPPDTHRWPFAPGDNALSETDADRGQRERPGAAATPARPHVPPRHGVRVSARPRSARSDDGPARDAAAATLEAAWDGGIRYFDTAPRYGAGLAERLLGDFLRGRAARRRRDLVQGRAAAESGSLAAVRRRSAAPVAVRRDVRLHP